jgi:hypothetical protein
MVTVMQILNPPLLMQKVVANWVRGQRRASHQNFSQTKKSKNPGFSSVTVYNTEISFVLG